MEVVIQMSSFGASFATSGLAVASSNYNANKDMEVASSPPDSISSLSFSPVANYLIATSWDNQVRCYEIQANGQSAGKAAISHDQPVLCSDWSADGSTVFTGQLLPSLPRMSHFACMFATWHDSNYNNAYGFTLRSWQLCRWMRQRCKDVEPADKSDPGGGEARRAHPPHLLGEGDEQHAGDWQLGQNNPILGSALAQSSAYAAAAGAGLCHGRHTSPAGGRSGQQTDTGMSCTWHAVVEPTA